MHHSPTPPPLPLPVLEDSLLRLRRSASAMITDDERAALDTQLRSFCTDPGPKLQETLEEFAQVETDRGENWMSAAWKTGYLQTRSPLQTSSNVGFQMRLEKSHGLAGVVELIFKAAHVHLAEAAGNTERELGFNQTPICMQQYRVLNGGLRIPGEKVDTWEPATGGTRDRFIGVLIHGRMWKIQITDDNGALVSSTAILHNLDHALSQGPSHANFADISGLGSAGINRLLAKHPTEANQRNVDDLREMLFNVTVWDPAPDVASEPDDRDAEIGSALTFTPGKAWAYKPITYQVGLTHDVVFVHVEHSVFDGATLASVWERIQDAPGPSETGSSETPMDELVWNLPTVEVTTEVPHATVVRVPRPTDKELPFRMSADARAQIIASTAQVLTYGNIRGTYEAVDMRQYQAGRTEVLRPVTPESAKFAHALATSTADRGMFMDALDAHREWVKAVKSGQGFDRHLMMLEEIASELGDVDTSFFANETVQAVRDNFLSTSSLGETDQIRRFFFAPVTDNGFGVNYSMYPDRGEFVVTWWEKSEKPRTFVSNLYLAARLLWDFVRTLD